MPVRVRFAPSPTGHLHVGGARTALYNYLFAKAQGGEFILRIEDTDEARSERRFEDVLVNNLKWLGLDYAEGPDKPGKFGPYRQSERQHIYKKHAQDLVDAGKAFYCFCSDELLESKKELAAKEGRSPHYDGTCRHLTPEDVTQKMASGEKPAIRFISSQKSYVFNDHVRGRVVFPEGMVGDFVIIRSSGLPVYNFCCVVDDWQMEMSHVIRAEEHLSNTLRQLMLYEAFGAKPPEFAHVSLLIGKDRQKLSKRHGATSVTQYQDESYLPEAMNNYLVQLGWSHPQEKDVFNVNELGALFTIDRFSKSPAIFDVEKFNFINGQHLRLKSNEELLEDLKMILPQSSEFYQYGIGWQLSAVNLFKDQVQFMKEMPPFIEALFKTELPSEKNQEWKDFHALPTTTQILEYLKVEIGTKKAAKENFIEAATYDAWIAHLSKEVKIKGKPLYKGIRLALTSEVEGPELKFLLPLTPLNVLEQRLHNLESFKG